VRQTVANLADTVSLSLAVQHLQGQQARIPNIFVDHGRQRRRSTLAQAFTNENGIGQIHPAIAAQHHQAGREIAVIERRVMKFLQGRQNGAKPFRCGLRLHGRLVQHGPERGSFGRLNHRIPPTGVRAG
jgi:hypothetical protein